LKRAARGGVKSVHKKFLKLNLKNKITAKKRVALLYINSVAKQLDCEVKHEVLAKPDTIWF
jgi:hypothetical protein